MVLFFLYVGFIGQVISFIFQLVTFTIPTYKEYSFCFVYVLKMDKIPKKPFVTQQNISWPGETVCLMAEVSVRGVIDGHRSFPSCSGLHQQWSHGRGSPSVVYTITDHEHGQKNIFHTVFLWEIWVIKHNFFTEASLLRRLRHCLLYIALVTKSTNKQSFLSYEQCRIIGTGIRYPLSSDTSNELSFHERNDNIYGVGFAKFHSS